MANTRSRSRRASSEQQPQPKPRDQKKKAIKVEPASTTLGPGRGPSPSMLRNTPQIKLEPTSDSDSDEESQEVVQVKVEVVSDPDTSSENDPDEVPELRQLAALRIANVTQSRSSRAGSVMSVVEAKATIDSFFTKPEVFMSDKKNKLKFWQSLCIEFGLVDMDADSGLAVIDEGEEESESESESGNSDYDSDSGSDSDSDGSMLAPLPTSLNQAKKLLKAEAHVNLKDYFAAREAERQRLKAHKKKQKNRRKKGKQPKEAEAERTDLSHLVHPSASAMIRYTVKHRKFVKVDRAKEAWLQPLLRSFHRRK